MVKDKATQLLEKYWQAETTIKEERLLKQYFVSHKLKDKQLIEAWFNSINDFKSIEVAEVHFTTPTTQRTTGKVQLLYMNYALKIAASIILISAVLVLGWRYNNIYQAKKELTIQREAEAGLLSISKTLNEGYQDLDQSSKIIFRVNKKKISL